MFSGSNQIQINQKEKNVDVFHGKKGGKEERKEGTEGGREGGRVRGREEDGKREEKEAGGGRKRGGKERTDNSSLGANMCVDRAESF